MERLSVSVSAAAVSTWRNVQLFERAISYTLNDFGLVSLKEEQRRAVEEIFMNGMAYCRRVSESL